MKKKKKTKKQKIHIFLVIKVKYKIILRKLNTICVIYPLHSIVFLRILGHREYSVIRKICPVDIFKNNN